MTNHTDNSDDKGMYALLGDVPALDPVSHDMSRPDLLNFKSTAAVLARCSVNTRDPLTIGIFGEWGTGKTSMMNLMKQVVEEERNAMAVWFNAWQYEKEEHLIVPLIATIDRSLEEYEKEHTGLKKEFKTFIRDLHDSLRGIIAGITIDFPLVKLSSKEAIARYEKLRKGKILESFYFEAFDQLKKCAKDMEAHGMRIVVFIDDMDRCLPDNAVKLLEGIKLVLHQPGFSFVLGVNDEIINHFIKAKYRKECNIPGELFDDYLDKMVQIKIPVPRRENEGMREYIGNLLKKGGILEGENSKDTDMQNDLISLTAHACNNNPRKVVRMLNRIMVTNWISNEDDKGKPDAIRIDPLAATIHILTEDFGAFRENLDIILTVEQDGKKEQTTIGQYLAGLVEGYDRAWSRVKDKIGEEKLFGRTDLLEKAIEIIDSKPFLCKVLQSKAGQQWLKDKAYRKQLGMAAQATVVKEQVIRPSEMRAEAATQAEVEKEQAAKTSKMRFGTKDPIDVLLSRLVKIPAGKFLMGSEEYKTEEPVREVMLEGFEISAMPVTQAQYQAVMGDNPSRFKGPDNPVEIVSWQDAMEFCKKLSEKTGHKFTLPSEAQWEYACRAGSKTRYCFGDDEDMLEEYAWYDKNSGGQTHPVGTLKPNDWGLYDMHGNVWEWCLDSWHDTYEGAPTDGSAWEPETGSFRVFRGGSWDFSARGCRSANRDWDVPGYRDHDLGFRVLAVR